MIKNIFFDLDETLAHTLLHEPNQNHLRVVLVERMYYTIVRPQAKEIIKFARELVGRNNVYILTVATKEYALEINDKAEWGFRLDQIHSREDLSNHIVNGAYGETYTVRNDNIAHKDNVLIDNLPHDTNRRKMSYIGITKENYLQVDDYYGVNCPSHTFERDVKNFLELKHHETGQTEN